MIVTDVAFPVTDKSHCSTIRGANAGCNSAYYGFGATDVGGARVLGFACTLARDTWLHEMKSRPCSVSRLRIWEER